MDGDLEYMQAYLDEIRLDEEAEAVWNRIKRKARLGAAVNAKHPSITAEQVANGDFLITAKPRMLGDSPCEPRR